MPDGVKEDAAKRCREIIQKVITDTLFNPIEQMTNAEMTEFICERLPEAFNLLGSWDFKTCAERGGDEAKTVFKYVAHLRMEIYETLHQAGLMSFPAYDLKFHESLFWYRRLGDLQAGRPSTWMN